MSDHGKKFVKGALILSIGGLIAKILSAFFRIPLTNMIGNGGVGYYQMPYPIYTMMLAISYVGIPSTVSKIISEKMVHKKYYEAHKVFQYTLILLVVISSMVSLLMFLGDDWLIKTQGWVPEAKYALWGLSFSPIFIGIMGVFRGYFQGMQNMVPTARSQIAESFGRTIFGLGAAYILMKLGKGIAMAAGGAAFGGTVGGIAGTTVLIVFYLKRRKEILDRVEKSRASSEELSFFAVVWKVINITFPVSIGAAVLSIMNGVDSSLVVRRLIDSGLSEFEAAGLFGQIGKVFTFINIPLALGLALVVGIVPAIAEAVERKNNTELKDKIDLGIRFSVLLGLPSTAGLCILAQPILSLTYVRYNEGANILSVLSFSLVFIMLGQTLTAVLQGMGRFYLPVINLFIAAAAKAVVNYILIPGPLGVNGASVGTIVGYVIFTLLNYIAVRKYSGYRINIMNVIIKPMTATAAMAGVTFVVYKLLNILMGGLKHTLIVTTISTLTAVLIAIIVYGTMVIITGAVGQREISMIPKGDKIMTLLKKYRLLKS